MAALHPDDRAECLRRVERALADPGPYLLLHRAILPDGAALLVASFTPLPST